MGNLSYIDIDQELLDLIRRALKTGWVSVHSEFDGDYREYSVLLDGSRRLMLSRVLVFSDVKETIYDYDLCIDEHELASAVISSGKKIHTPKEQVLLELFAMCSRQVIAQEMRALLNSHAEKKFYC